MEGWANLGAILLEQGLFQEAVPILQRAKMLAPGVGVVHLNLAQAYFLADQDTEALAACRQAVALTPTADALNKLGVILRRSGQFAEAEDAFRKALARDGNHPNAVVNIATLLMLMGRFPEAAQALKTAAGKPLPADARSELRQASLLMTEWQRIQPVISESFPLGNLDELTRALDATPPALLVPDPVVPRSGRG
jgi:tetratricopeptide (TPR) repeat protein